MPQPKEFDLVSFRMDRRKWLKFVKLCRSKDRTASEVLRNYINLTLSTKLQTVDAQYRVDHKPAHFGKTDS